MFAASAGARHVSACEVSKTMYDVAVKVLESNALTEDVKLIHIKSTDLLIPQHVPERLDCIY